MRKLKEPERLGVQGEREKIGQCGASRELDPREQVWSREENNRYMAERKECSIYVWRLSSRAEPLKSASTTIVSVKGGHNRGEGCSLLKPGK